MRTVPKVSVLIPTYNYAHYLDETIQSVLTQTFTDFELVIVDNCSTDNTDEVVKKYLADKRMSFHRNETNLGLVGNWNKCLDYAGGEYIKFLCADDKFHPQLLEKFVAVMDQYPGVSLISCYNELFGLKTLPRMQPFTGLVSGQLIWEKFIKEGTSNWLYNPSAVMFRKTGLTVGRFDSGILTRTDKEFYLRLLTIGDCYIIPEFLCFIRAHQNTQSSIIGRKKYEPAFQDYYYFASLKKASASKLDSFGPVLNARIKKSATNCTAIMYKLIPGLYKKENREMFGKAFRIGRSEGVLLAPFSRLFKQKQCKPAAGK